MGRQRWEEEKEEEEGLKERDGSEGCGKDIYENGNRIRKEVYKLTMHVAYKLCLCT